MTNAARALFWVFRFAFFSLFTSCHRRPRCRPNSFLRDPAICDLVEDLGLGLRVGGQPAWNWLTLGESAPGSGSRLLRLGLGSWLHRKDLGIQVHFMQVRKGILGLEMASTGLSVGFLDRSPLLTTVKPSSVGGSLDALALDPRARYSSRVMRFQEARSFSRAVWYLLLVWFLGTEIVRMGMVD